MKRTFVSLALAALIGLPVGWVLSMALTPILWRLEPILHMELAGHSGPSDWIFWVVWAILIPCIFFLVQGIARRTDQP